MRPCRGPHQALIAEEFSPMGVHVSCLRCGDTFHITETTLAERYYHAHHNSADGPQGDIEFFLLDDFVEARIK
jgi:hypothetical protein